MFGYKAFDKNLINQFHKKYKEGHSYFSKKDLEYQKTGFYFCRNLEDVFRYYDGFSDIEIARVKSFGKVRRFFDEYNEYETFCSQGIEIVKVLSRKDIISYGLKLDDYRLKRFISGFKLTDEEIEMFIAANESCQEYIEYYQKGNDDAFTR